MADLATVPLAGGDRRRGSCCTRIALGATGFGLSTRFDQAGLSTCHSVCSSLASNFFTTSGARPYAALFFGCVVLMYLAPALMGIFWGAPLIARELETGTNRLAWNQSVTRTRWTAVKLGLVGLAAVGTAGLLSLMISWWAQSHRPCDELSARPSVGRPADQPAGVRGPRHCAPRLRRVRVRARGHRESSSAGRSRRWRSPW